ncbi:hypothetical protein H310_00291 [Aphanomyces invadans]|uniref:STI1 domain-containing protein n=1 Tax=Aphanomyces invadans TaxID=157072 RepID=A0A024UTJ1_9STRA|nr:hypothetical protein H310_00291 [Aphanomyces invadans]ETW09831.1 hypothetical protein H310_00291 [Aphanomyces invadans]|eukprot:XP_008861242.1 hypothetical protein H310_00291 [Aphanomyces invadans]
MDEPPPLCSLSMLEEVDNQRNDETSVMDEMLAVATRAKAIKDAAKRADERKRNQTFGGGLKKGFFRQAKPPKKEVATVAPPDIPTIRRNPAKESLHIPEVHAAMNQMQNLKPDDWMTPAFFEKLAQNPKLCQAMQNPRFTAAIQEMSSNPTSAMLKYQSDPHFGAIFKDFLEFMGQHFEELGKIEEEKSKPPTKQDIQRAALTSMPTTPDEEVVVQRVLADPELQEILSDADMQRVLRACQQPGVLSTFMKDPVYGPKIQKLVRAGLVQLHP